MIMLRSLFLCMISSIVLCNALTTPSTKTESKQQESQAVVTELAQQQQLFQEQKYMIRKAAPLLFLGWPDITNKGYEVKPLPIDYDPGITQTTDHQKIMSYLDTVFGTKGLGCDADLLKYIKEFYFYFEYLTRIEKATKIIAQAENKKINWQTTIQTKGWGELLKTIGAFTFTAVETDLSMWDKLYTDNQNLLIPADQKRSTNYWTDLQKTSFWSIPVSVDEMRSSLFWQDYCKFMISNSIYCNADYCQSKEGAAYHLISHVQNIESSYYIPDFTYERHQYETAQLSLVLNNAIKDRLIQQCIDWQKIPLVSKDQQDLISVAQDIRQTPIIQKFLTISDPAFIKTATATSDVFTSKTMFEQQETRIIGMAMALGLLIQDLFDDYKTAQQSVYKLTTIPQQAFIPNFPSLLMYQPQDAPYILDLAYLHEHLSNNAEQNAQATTITQQLSAADATQQTTTTTSKATITKASSNPLNPAVKPSNIFNDIGGFFEDVGNTVAGWSKSIYGDLLTSDGIFASFGKIVYYGSGAAMAFQGASWDECKNKLESVKSDLVSNLHDLSTTCGSIVGKAAAFAAAYGTLPLALGGGVAAAIFQDQDLFSDVTHIYDKVGDAVGSYFGHLTELAGTAVVVLSGEGIAFFSGLVMQTVSGNWEGLGENFMIFGKDLVNGLLQGLVIAVDLLKSEWDIIGKAIGYLVKTITDLIIDVVAGSMVLFTGQFDQFSQTKAEVAKHRRLISQGVGVGLFIGATVLTGGLGGVVGGAFFAATFAIPSLISGAQQDNAAEEARQELNNFFKHYAVMIQNQKQMSSALNKEYERDIKAQYDALWLNQKLANSFTENEQIDALNSFECSEAYALGAYQMQQLQKDDATGLYKADPGNIFKYWTKWLNLNPSQGIVLYEPARACFAQEAAITPNFVKQGNEKGPKETLFWFLQNVTQNVSRSTSSFEIRFRPLYILDHFYIGVGIGGIPLNTRQIQDSGLANLDQYYHAKMVVFHKDNTTGTRTNIGVYEHESPLNKTGWLTTNPWQEEQLTPGNWYHLKIEMPAQSTNLSFKAWKEADQKVISSGTIAVTKPEDHDFVSNRSVCPAQSGQAAPFDVQQLMVIFSGASIEWTIVNPQEKYQSLQTKEDQATFTNMGTEKTTTQNSNQYKTYAKLVMPFANDIGLELASLYDAMKGYYVYRTNKTTTIAGKGNILDYLILGTLNNDASALLTTGNSPTQKNNALISLVTGITYRITATSQIIPQSFSDLWAAYKQNNAISQALINKIEAAQQDYFGQTNVQNTFGLFTITPVNTTSKGQFIFKTNLRLDPDMNNKALQEDYVMFVNVDQYNNIKKINLPLGSADANGLISLTTSFVYDKNANPFITPTLHQKKDTTIAKNSLDTLTDDKLKQIIKSAQAMYAPFIQQYQQTTQPTPATDTGTNPSETKQKPPQGQGGKGTIIIQQSGDEDIDLGIL